MASEKRVVAAWTAAVSQVNCSTPIDTRSRRSKNIMQRQTGLHLGATPDELQSRLLNAPHDGGDGSAQAMLIDYARSGRYDHVRTFITSDLARAATARDAPLRPFFTEGLSNPVRGYWSILGYIRVAQDSAFVVMDSLHHQREDWIDDLAPSGSRSPSSSMEPLRSANSTVICLRSPSRAVLDVRIFSARYRGVYASGDGN